MTVIAAPGWIACTEERPSDKNAVWHVDCEGCRVKADAEWAQADADPNGERALFFYIHGGPPRPADVGPHAWMDP